MQEPQVGVEGLDEGPPGGLALGGGCGLVGEADLGQLAAGRLVGRIAWIVDSRHRNVALANLAAAYGEALLALANLAPRLGATPKEQIDWLERARKASPGAVEPQLMLVQVYARAGDAKKALEGGKAAAFTLGKSEPEAKK
mgnify:CR=1 FL=1